MSRSSFVMIVPAFNKSTETPASSASPTTDRRALRGRHAVGVGRIAHRALRRARAPPPMAAGRAHARTHGRRLRRLVVSVGPAGSGGSGDGGSSRSMFGSVSNTKNRSCGFSVAPISLRGFSMPMVAAQPREALARDVVHQHRRILHAHAAPSVPGARTGPGRSAVGPRFQRRQRQRPIRSDELRVVPTPARRARARSIRVFLHQQPQLRRLRDVDVEAADAALRPATVGCRGSAARAAARRASAVRRATASA